MFTFEKEYKGWSLERSYRHILYWAFWLTSYCIANGAYHENTYLMWMLFELTIMCVKLPYAYLVIYYLMPRFLPHKQYLYLTISVITLGLLANLPIHLIYKSMAVYGPYTASYWSPKTFFHILDLIYVTSLVVIIKLVQEYYRQQQANTQLHQEKIRAELQILKNQLQPHFLFNTLNNIYSLVISHDSQAGNALLKLSDMLSYMLYDCNVERIALKKEIDLITNYIQLEKLRYGDRLDLSFQVEGDTYQNSIAPLLLIPFVENAFKHGVAKSNENSWIRIHLDITDSILSFLVENNLPPSLPTHNTTPIKSGIGLENMRKRLQLLYPDRYTIQNTHNNDSFLIHLKLSL